MEKSRKKVFCQDCLFECDWTCNYPKNLRDDAYGPKHEHIDTLEYLNQVNDCPWFKLYKK